MENLDQIQLLYINLGLLMFTASIALYLPKKIQKAHQLALKPVIHPEFTLFYSILNESLRFHQATLTYVVDKMPVNQFVSFYKGLEYIHGFKVDLKSRRLDNGTYSEYIVLDLASYTGPRQVKVAMYEETKRPLNPSAAQLYREASRPTLVVNPQLGENVFSIFNRRSKKMSFKERNENNVVDLNSYRKNRVINYIPDGNEGA